MKILRAACWVELLVKTWWATCPIGKHFNSCWRQSASGLHNAPSIQLTMGTLAGSPSQSWSPKSAKTTLTCPRLAPFINFSTLMPSRAGGSQCKWRFQTNISHHVGATCACTWLRQLTDTLQMPWSCSLRTICCRIPRIESASTTCWSFAKSWPRGRNSCDE